MASPDFSTPAQLRKVIKAVQDSGLTIREVVVKHGAVRLLMNEDKENQEPGNGGPKPLVWPPLD